MSEPLEQQKYRVYGLGGMFEVSATNEDQAIKKAYEQGLITVSWVKRVEEMECAG